MRWEDERYVRVYTRDTGDWLDLSFEAQGLFLMLLRKLDRIGELHLGKRGRSTVPALVGHPNKTKAIMGALEELIADGCVRLSDGDERLFVPNFLKAQEAAKSPAERKREQRERDAAKALENTGAGHEMSRDVTMSRDGHEMSPRAVPSRAEPPEPAVTTVPMDGVRSPSALVAPKSLVDNLVPGRRWEDRPHVPPPKESLREMLERVWLEETGSPYTWKHADELATQELILYPDELVEKVWRHAATSKFPNCLGVASLVRDWNAFAKGAAGKKPNTEAAEATPLKHLG